MLATATETVREWLQAVRGAVPDAVILEIELWRWIALGIVLLVSLAAAWIGPWLVTRVLRAFLEESDDTADGIRRTATGPLRLAVGLIFFGAFGGLVGMPPRLAFVQRVLLVVAIAWLALRLVDVLVRAAEGNLARRGSTLGASVAALARKTAKFLVVGATFLLLLRAYGIDITGIIAGLGLGGLAFALAAQKTVENLFGGVTLITDQPVRVGDFCRFGDRVGTVEDVGLRSTRVRTLDRTVVTIPNGEFASLQLENYARRDKIWFKHVIGVLYETTPAQMRQLLGDLQKVLRDHPRVLPDPARARFVGFNDSSLDIELFAYVDTSDINEYLVVQQELLLQIMDAVEAVGTGFAFPSRTIYAAGGDEDRQRLLEEMGNGKGADA